MLLFAFSGAKTGIFLAFSGLDRRKIAQNWESEKWNFFDGIIITKKRFLANREGEKFADWLRAKIAVGVDILDALWYN